MATPGATERIGDALGLEQDELCEILGLGPIELLAGDGDLLPQVGVLDELLRAALAAGVDRSVLRRWARTRRADDRSPVDALRERDYAAFEASLDELQTRGVVLRGGRRRS